ncbi:hypothetical protein BGZ51_002029 [Haplosporangium sp. Z 767]|nr:hypothetical protein BGZ51_002029 [Haplosporangium sp. Z 767]KAF9195403.1 hypothetical protein BGZ50_004574 [Haplosporangium sp. Z 11]
MAMVNSFLESQQQQQQQQQQKRSNNAVNRDKIVSYDSTAIGILPTTAELLNPTTALRQRLLRNPGISDLARLEVLRIECSTLLQHQRQQHTDTLNHEPGLNSIHGLSPETLASVLFRLEVMGLHTRYDLDSDEMLAELSRETIERKAQAQVIFQRICSRSGDSTVLLDPETALDKLREYKEASHSEAVEVIRHLSAMVNKAATEDPADVSHVDWTAFAGALWRLERE